METQEYTGPAVAAYVDNTLVYHSSHEAGRLTLWGHIHAAKLQCQHYAMGVYAVAPHYRHKGKRAEISVAGKTHSVSEALAENQEAICDPSYRLAWEPIFADDPGLGDQDELLQRQRDRELEVE